MPFSSSECSKRKNRVDENSESRVFFLSRDILVFVPDLRLMNENELVTWEQFMTLISPLCPKLNKRKYVTALIN